jgi:hypothetical protein
MTRDEVLQLARAEAKKNGWTWLEPAKVEVIRGFLIWGRRIWRVATNHGFRGCNAWFEIDDEAKVIVTKSYCPR